MIKKKENKLEDLNVKVHEETNNNCFYKDKFHNTKFDDYIVYYTRSSCNKNHTWKLTLYFVKSTFNHILIYFYIIISCMMSSYVILS